MNTVIYHDRCHDGFAAALAAHLVFGDMGARYLGASHGDPVPEVSGGVVYVLDFAYPLEGMQALAKRADRLVWLDHHASVLDVRADFEAWLTATGQTAKAHVVLDMGHSGAVLAWQHFFPQKPVPRLFRHVEDRDLWRWALPETEGFTSALDDLPFDFGIWKDLLARVESDPAYAEFVRAGEIGHRKYLKLCAEIAERAEPIVIDGVQGLQVNATGDFASHVGNLLAQKSGTFGLIWYVKEGVVRLSFRGERGFNVIPLAAKYGGGGHSAAAGARIPLARLGEIIRTPESG
jgi:oligoribonuclease NrnB/cAMP/cGMP phosphodiesterase (DHH superfamily)